MAENSLLRIARTAPITAQRRREDQHRRRNLRIARNGAVYLAYGIRR